MKYRTKPQTVEAVQWRGDNEAETVQTLGSYWGSYIARFGIEGFWYANESGHLRGFPGDVFAEKFEPVNEEVEGE